MSKLMTKVALGCTLFAMTLTTIGMLSEPVEAQNRNCNKQDVVTEKLKQFIKSERNTLPAIGGVLRVDWADEVQARTAANRERKAAQAAAAAAGTAENNAAKPGGATGGEDMPGISALAFTSKDLPLDKVNMPPPAFPAAAGRGKGGSSNPPAPLVKPPLQGKDRETFPPLPPKGGKKVTKAANDAADGQSAKGSGAAAPATATGTIPKKAPATGGNTQSPAPKNPATKTTAPKNNASKKNSAETKVKTENRSRSASRRSNKGAESNA